MKSLSSSLKSCTKSSRTATRQNKDTELQSKKCKGWLIKRKKNSKVRLIGWIDRSINGSPKVNKTARDRNPTSNSWAQSEAKCSRSLSTKAILKICWSNQLTHLTKKIARCLWLNSQLAAKKCSLNKLSLRCDAHSRSQKTSGRRLSSVRSKSSSWLRRRWKTSRTKSERKLLKLKCLKRWLKPQICNQKRKTSIFRDWTWGYRDWETDSHPLQVAVAASPVSRTHVRPTTSRSSDRKRSLSVTRCLSKRETTKIKWHGLDVKNGRKLLN